MIRPLLRSRVARILSVVLVAGQVLTAIPVLAAPAAPTPASPTTPSTPPPAPPQVTVNRTVPKVTAPPAEPQFSDAPTVEEIFRARVFAEPLVPIGGEPTPGENRVLAQALLAFHHTGGTAWESTLGPFLLEHPTSAWRPSLLANLGTVQLHAHAYSRALASFNEAWVLTKDATDAKGRAVADGAVAEWLTVAASFGMIEAAQARLNELAERSMTGSASAKVTTARETIGLISRHPEKTIPCGPEALLALLASEGRGESEVLTRYVPTAAGTSLAELEILARRAGLALRMAYREASTAIPVPAIVHLKVGHYIAITEHEGNRYRVQDRSLATSYWISRDTLLDESSGYALVSSGPLPDGWRVADNNEGRGIIGRGPLCPDGAPPPPPACDPSTQCCVAGGAPSGPGPGGGGPSGDSGNDSNKSCASGSCGMPVYQLQQVTASLVLHDTPVGHTPPRGPNLQLTFSYHQRDVLQPQIFTMSNLGHKWSFDWLRFVQEVPADALGVTPAHVWVAQRASGREVYVNPDAQGVYGAHWASRAVLVRVSESPLRYERRLPDGTVEAYTLSDGAPAGQRRVFLTQLTDPRGQSVQLTWDSQARLVAMTDAIGQVTTLTYGLASDPLKITKATDPFGRFATFTYNAAGQLASITDVLGLTSSFAYGPDDFITALTTPYGRTSFRHESNAANIVNQRFIEATDPLGGTEHVEFQWETPSLAATAPASDVPTGFTAWNINLDHYNTFYWSKRAWMLGAGDLSKAVVTHWMVGPEWPGWQKYSYVPHSIKQPLEGRVWYSYPDQLTGQEDTINGVVQPSRVGRVLEDGSSQIYQNTYNAQGSVLTKTDPLGRQTSYTYAGNGVDILEVRQTTGGMNDLLASYANYNAQHEPQSVTDAAGQTMTMTYNAAGQVLTVSNAKNETTTSAYDTEGRLQSVTGPVNGATTSYAYDPYGRVRTVTDPDAYTVTTDYDQFDRLVRTTYPDGSYEETLYDRLDVSTRRDRAGRVARYYYDALRRLVATRDPLGRIIGQQWCACGSLDALVDPNGHRTRWERDLQGRVTREVRADNVTATSYTYGSASGRLATATDPKGQVTTRNYALDDQLLSTLYTNAQIATATVTYTYDAQYSRVATMTDGTGLTTYTYHPAGVLGAGHVASVDGPLTDDTITYAYDQLGRVTTRAINGVTNTATWTFDTLGRISSEVNVLGSFTYTYEGVTARVATLVYPNGQTSSYSYLDNAHDRRLETIHHKYPGGATLSRFDYSYDAVGNVLTWRQQADSTAVLWSYGYDAADQLTWAIKKSTDAVPTILKTYTYGYDAAGNRTSEQIDDQLTGATYDALNRLVSQQPTGVIVVEGTVSEPASLTVQGKPVMVSVDGHFATTTPVVQGTNTLTISATDPSGNATSKQYEVDSTGGGRTFTYDANGNLTGDGTRTLEWDSRNQLVAVNVGNHRSGFAYDGSQRRVRVVEIENAVLMSDTLEVWCGHEICERRAADNSSSTVRSFNAGQQVDTIKYFFSADHLGSVRATTDTFGAVLGRYDFDPWGQFLLNVGGNAFDVSWAGLEWHQYSGQWLAEFRAYSADRGAWDSEDPLGVLAPDGPNLYAYVSDSPLRYADPLGLQRAPSQQALSYPPPTPPGCTSIGVGVYICKPDPTPRLCAAPKPPKCVPVYDRWLYYSCLAVKLTSPTLYYPSPGGTGASAVVTALSCNQAAVRCAGGGMPPAPPSTDVPELPFQATKPPQWGGRR
jgi:RHS repeat-associated protein